MYACVVANQKRKKNPPAIDLQNDGSAQSKEVRRDRLADLRYHVPPANGERLPGRLVQAKWITVLGYFLARQNGKDKTCLNCLVN